MKIKEEQRVQFRTGMHLAGTDQEIVWEGITVDHDKHTDSWLVRFDESTGEKLEPWMCDMHSSELESA